MRPNSTVHFHQHYRCWNQQQAASAAKAAQEFYDAGLNKQTVKELQDAFEVLYPNSQ
jgi:hypothetical protein